jgi:hypothetical protein
MAMERRQQDNRTPALRLMDGHHPHGIRGVVWRRVGLRCRLANPFEILDEVVHRARPLTMPVTNQREQLIHIGPGAPIQLTSVFRVVDGVKQQAIGRNVVAYAPKPVQ